MFTNHANKGEQRSGDYERTVEMLRRSGEENQKLREALKPFVEGASHTRVFLTSREKMNPIGVDLYDKDVERAKAALGRD